MHKKAIYFCPTLGMNLNQDMIHICNNMKNLLLAKEQYAFSKCDENPSSCGQTKWLNFPLISCTLLNKNVKNDDP